MDLEDRPHLGRLFGVSKKIPKVNFERRRPVNNHAKKSTAVGKYFKSMGYTRKLGVSVPHKTTAHKNGFSLFLCSSSRHGVVCSYNDRFLNKVVLVTGNGVFALIRNRETNK